MIKLSDDQMSALIRALSDTIDLIYNRNGTITQNVIDDDEADGDIPQELLAYKIKVNKDGDHRNDGQLVDYTFIFTSPKNKKTTICTEMCLMVGWNFCENEYTIK